MISSFIVDTVVDQQAIREALNEVMDPEIPVLSVNDLGIIGDITIHDQSVSIALIPTFAACPAINYMQQQIRQKIMSLGFEKVDVNIDRSIAWNSDRISEEGKKKLQQFGLGIPIRHHGKFDLNDIEQSVCPHCSSSNTTMNSLFGSALCRSMHYCFDCRQGFERFKPI
jgi:ring-1,2-phenylacetyl-CoA epoxidase subunit PaaD